MSSFGLTVFINLFLLFAFDTHWVRIEPGFGAKVAHADRSTPEFYYFDFESRNSVNCREFSDYSRGGVLT